MIQGNSTWNSAIAAETVQPLWVLEIPDLATPVFVASFLKSLITSPPSGTWVPYLRIPTGAGQSVTEEQGQSSISQLDCEAIDLDLELLTLAANQALLGQPVNLKLGFPGQAYSAFVTIFSGTLTSLGQTTEGLITFQVQDTQKQLISTIWLNGGPTIPSITPSGGASYTNTSAVSSIALPAMNLLSSTASGSFAGFPMAVLVAVILADTTKSVSSITDTAGNTFTRQSAINATGVRVELWACYPAIQNTSNVITVTLSGSSLVNVYAVQYENVLALGATATGSGAADYGGKSIATLQPGSWVCEVIGFASTAGTTPDYMTALAGFKRQGGGSAVTTVDGGIFDSSTPSCACEFFNYKSQVASRTWAAAAVTLEGQFGAVAGDDKNPEPQYDNAFADNGAPIEDTNRRFLYGHPLDILLVALQNEIGLGQNPTLGPAIVDETDGSGGTEIAVFGPNPSWQRYTPGNDSTLINPNAYLDVDGIRALRDGEFHGERMEFVITRAVTGKSWIEDQILKPLGLYFVCNAAGQLKLKSMTAPQFAPWAASWTYTAGQEIVDGAGHLQKVTVAGASGGSTPTWNDTGGTTSDGGVTWQDLGLAVMPVNDHMILGIPQIDRLPIINFITVRSNVNNAQRETAARQYNFDETYIQWTSVDKYKQQFAVAMESDGLKSGIGAGVRSFLTTDRTFKRHGFGTPSYEFTAQLRAAVLELGDFISLTHGALADFELGAMGVTGVLCEIYDRQPDYSNGTVKFKVLDTRSFGIPSSLSLIGTSTMTTDGYSGASNRIF